MSSMETQWASGLQTCERGPILFSNVTYEVPHGAASAADPPPLWSEAPVAMYMAGTLKVSLDFVRLRKPTPQFPLKMKVNNFPHTRTFST